MNLRYLDTFCVVADVGSFTAAAQRLGITQSAVSLQLQKLEREFGARLIDRGRQPVVLTAAGEALVREGREILRRYAAARDGVQRTSDQVEGTLCLAASTIPGEYILPGVLARFREAHPGIRLELVITDTAGVYRLLTEGAATFGFTGWHREDLGLTLEPFAHDEIVLVGPAGSEPGPHDLEWLSSQVFLAREAGSGTMAAVHECLGSVFAQIPPLEAAMVLGSTQALLGAVQAGAGVGFVSSRAAHCSVGSGGLVRMLISGVHISRELWMAYHPARATGALREAFLAFVRGWQKEGGAIVNG